MECWWIGELRHLVSVLCSVLLILELNIGIWLVCFCLQTKVGCCELPWGNLTREPLSDNKRLQPACGHCYRILASHQFERMNVGFTYTPPPTPSFLSSITPEHPPPPPSLPPSIHRSSLWVYRWYCDAGWRQEEGERSCAERGSTRTAVAALSPSEELQITPQCFWDL